MLGELIGEEKGRIIGNRGQLYCRPEEMTVKTTTADSVYRRLTAYTRHRYAAMNSNVINEDIHGCAGVRGESRGKEAARPRRIEIQSE